MDEIWTEAIQNYLLSEDFQHNIQSFLQSKTYLFTKADEEKETEGGYRHIQHKAWTEFQDLVEQMLEKVLEELGGTFDALEKALDERVSAPPRGPRDAAEKEILAQLLTFASFVDFCHMMHRLANGGQLDSPPRHTFGRGRANEQRHNDDEEDEDSQAKMKKMAKQLHEFGFEKELCKQAVRQFDDFDSCVAWCCDQTRDNDQNEQNDSDNEPDASGSAPQNSSNFQLQCIMAQSIMEAKDAGTLTAHDQGMIPWAEAMLELATILQSCDFDIAQLGHSRKTRVDELHHILQEEQKIVDRIVSEVSADGGESGESELDAERRRLEGIMQNASKAEQDLEAMFVRADELQRTTVKQRDQVKVYTRPPHSVNNDSLEEIYLFIKEMVHGGQDLAEHKDQIHEYVFARIESSAANLIPALLELMLQEEEMVMLNRHIRKALDPTSASSEADTDGDVLTGNGFPEPHEDFNSSSHEGNPEGKNDKILRRAGSTDDEENLSELERLNQKYQRDKAALDAAMEKERQRQRVLLEERMRKRREKMLAEGHSEEEIDALERKDRAALEERLNMLEKGLNMGMSRRHEAVLRATSQAKRKLTNDEVDDSSKAALEMIKKKYFEEEEALRKLINGERQLQKNRLSEKLRKAREAKLSKLMAEGMSAAELEAVEARLVQEDELKLEQLDEEFDQQIEKALAAPKQRYYGAMVAPTVVEWEVATGFHESKSEGEDWLKALQEIKDRHEAHSQVLSEQMAAMKRKKQQNLKDRIAREKQKRKAELEALGASASEIQEAMEVLDKAYFSELCEVDEELHKQHQETATAVFKAQQFELESFAQSNEIDYNAYLEKIRAGNISDRSAMESIIVSEKERQQAELQERMRKRRAAKLAKLENEGVDSEVIQESLQIIEKEEQEEMEQYQVAQRKMLDMVMGTEDTKRMIERINAESKSDANTLQLSVDDEKRRQKEEMKRRLAEKKAKKLAASAAQSSAPKDNEEEHEAHREHEHEEDINEQMHRIVKENEEEREKMEMVMQIEQARQRQAMQAKLMAKREKRRQQAAEAESNQAASSQTHIASSSDIKVKFHHIAPLPAEISQQSLEKLKKVPVVNAATMKYMEQRGWGIGKPFN